MIWPSLSLIEDQKHSRKLLPLVGSWKRRKKAGKIQTYPNRGSAVKVRRAVRGRLPGQMVSYGH